MSIPSTIQSAGLRNLIHAAAFVIFAPVLGALADPRNKVPHATEIVVGFLLLVTLLNFFVLPRLETGKRIARPGERVAGLVFYPFSLALCFALFPPFAAMGAWAAMAGGDSAASAVGRLVPLPKLAWNKDKSWAGLLAFVAAAIPLCFIALYGCPSQQFLKRDLSPEIPFAWTLAVLAACCGAALESLAEPFDDNVRVPLGVATVLWLGGSFLSFATRGLPRDTHVQPEQFLHALVLNGLLGLGVLICGFADIPGILAGITIGVVIYFFAGPQGYLLFALFVVAGSVLSKAGLKKKQALGVAEAREGKRGIGNVAANLLVPALCCLAYPASGGNPACLLAFAGAISAAFADTASSELGVLSKAPPVLITSWKPVAHGTNGAITPLGLVAALGASSLTAVAGLSGGFFNLILSPLGRVSAINLALLSGIVIAAGIMGSLMDSLLGATLEDKWPGVGKGVVNFACTLTGAGLAAGAMATWHAFVIILCV